MTYKIEVCDYNGEDATPTVEQAIDWLFKSKKLLMVSDTEIDDTIVIVSRDVDRDMQQAQIICDALNENK